MTALVDAGPRMGAPAAATDRRRARRLTRPVGFVALVGLAVAVAGLSVAVGAKTLALSDVLSALTDFDGTLESHVIVQELRIPRTAMAMVVGAALGLAGALMQGITRNPLADPGLLGVNAGAALGVVGATFVLGSQSSGSTVWFSLAGAALAGTLVYGLGSGGRGGATPVKLAIAGAALSALLGSITSALLLLDSASLDQYRFWAVGSVAGRSLGRLGELAPFLVAGVLLALGSARSIDSLAMGDDVARSLGQRVGLTRAVAAASIVLLCGASTAAVGPIWFVGLTVPHIARAMTGPVHRWLLPYAMVLGGILLTSADIVGRLVVRPGELEVGVVTAFIGAPVFIAFVRRRRIAEL